ncbi:MAG: outer membrane protein assembly factor BamD [Victivallaceae bacterium]|nr:outer membrane protein assembly factor BamD [Victivallaceae bacterium]
MRYANLGLIVAALVAALPFGLHGGDSEAQRLYSEGYAAYNKGDYRDAADAFDKAGIEADSPVIKANSLKAIIAAWQMCEMPYKEFTAIETLLERYPDYADFVTLVNREYEIGELFYQGKREPAYWSLRWVPWLHGNDHSEEIFRKAIERAPFAPPAARARLRLAQLLDDAGKPAASVDELRALVRDYPQAAERPYALLSLANGLLELAKKGDGDGRYTDEAGEALRTFLAEYPKSSEADWVQRKLLTVDDLRAERRLVMAHFYERQGKNIPAMRYYAEVLKNYPSSDSAAEAEKRLVELDRSYAPGENLPSLQDRLPRYLAYPIPSEATKLLINPYDSDRRYLQPIYDIKMDESAQPAKEKK